MLTQDGAQGGLGSSRLKEGGRLSLPPTPRDPDSPAMPMTKALPCHILGCPPWGAASLGGGPDLQVAHIHIPAKMNWLHTTPTTYTRKKMWSAASTQLLLGPLTPLEASVSGEEEREPFFRFHTAHRQRGEAQGVWTWVSPFLRVTAEEYSGLACSRPPGVGKAPSWKGCTRIRAFTVSWALGKSTLLPAAGLLLPRADTGEPRKPKAAVSLPTSWMRHCLPMVSPLLSQC